MAKGNEAKRAVIQKIQAAFGNDFVGEFDKKVYVWAEENGEKIQIALSLTCPKVPVGAIHPANKLDFSDDAVQEAAPVNFEPTEITEEERMTVEELMKALGL